ncbi:MAG: helicase [Phycisphaeraceae bacterium]|nr:MAG: helicase [Phycisphaeraceae bacterium]
MRAKHAMTTSITNLLGSDGPIARALGEGYEPRPQQLEMAERVAGAMADKSHLLVEAGTGVGKSFAYLVPAIRRCLANGEKVVVATNTIALQEQLVHRDIPLLASTINEDPDDPNADPGWSGRLKPVLVKGRGNYVSIRRLKLASGRQDKLFADAGAKRSLHVIEDWAYDTEDGSLATLPPIERPGVWDKVQSDSGNCMGRRCPHYQECFYQQARREMEQANLLVCNHALFFADLALRARGSGMLPVYQHVILDEAHGVEDVAADHFGVRVTEGRVFHLLSSLVSGRGNKGFLPQLVIGSGDMGAVERAISLVRIADAAARDFFDEVLVLSQTDEAQGGRVRRAGAVDNPLTPAMNDLVIRLRSLRDEVQNDADRFELNAYAERATAIANAAEVLVDQTVEGCCYWIEAGGSGDERSRRRTNVTLACSPIEVGPLLEEHLFGKEHSVILTSATLATRTIEPDEPAERAETAFAHVLDRLGCEGAETLQLGSPFEFGKQVELFVDRSMPAPTYGGRTSGESFEDALALRIMDHVAATDGGAFVLFTSLRTLDLVAARLEGPLESLGHPALVQRAGVSRTRLLDDFRADPRSVLFGAASFWQGVDVRGEALRSVIITRLPFDPPGRPLTEARLERIKERGGDPFREDSIPRAVIRFKQGFGRLVRSHTDTGRVVVLDPRIVTKSYGRKFIESLPAGVDPVLLGG